MRRARKPSGRSAMLPVRSSDPAITTSTSPSVKTAPVISVWTPPHACGSSPAEATMASRPAKAMYAPARKPATSALSQDRPAFVTPDSTPAAAISDGVLYDTVASFGALKRTPGSRPGHTRSADGEHALHPGLGVAGHGAEVAEPALLVERDAQPRRLARAGQGRLLAADAEVVLHGAGVVKAEGDGAWIWDRRLGEVERELLARDRDRGRGGVGGGARSCRGEPDGRERGDGGGRDDELVHGVLLGGGQESECPRRASVCRRRAGGSSGCALGGTATAC